MMENKAVPACIEVINKECANNLNIEKEEEKNPAGKS